MQLTIQTGWNYNDIENSLLVPMILDGTSASEAHVVCFFSLISLLWLLGTHTHTHNHLTALSPGLSGWASTRKVKPIWILLKQETVSGVGFSWAVCKSAPRSRQITTPAPHHSVFTGQMPFLPSNQQRQSTEGISLLGNENPLFWRKLT